VPHRQTKRDELAISQLRAVHSDNPYYGVERLAIALNWSEAKARRIRNLAGVFIPRPSKKRRTGVVVAPEIAAPENALKTYAVYKDASRPQDGQNYAGMAMAQAWVQDFTYVWFERQWHYLAVVLDLETRQLLGWALGMRHSSELTLAAVLDALSKHPAPRILHSDQGSEYLSYKHRELCDRQQITLSCSAKGSPWQNGFMERWFGTFMHELGPLSRFRGISELYEGIALQVYYYNTKRIHTTLKMSPAAYAARLKARSVKSLDKVFVKVRG
jgi:transposase InsO family protein